MPGSVLARCRSCRLYGHIYRSFRMEISCLRSLCPSNRRRYQIQSRSLKLSLNLNLVTMMMAMTMVAIPSSQHQMQKQKPAAESLSSLHPKTKPKTSLLGDAVATTEFSPKLVVQRVQSPSDGKKSRLDPFNALFRSTVGKIHAFKDLGAHHHRGAKKWGPLLIGPSIT